MESFNFDQLREVIRRLYEKVEHLEELLMNLSPTATDDNSQVMNIQDYDFLFTI